MNTLIELLDEAATRYGERPAVSTHRGLRDRTWTYRELQEAAGAVAGYLRRDLGLAVGTPVVVWGPNSPQLVATFFGIMRARLLLVPIDPTAPADFVARVTKLTGAGLLISAFSIPDQIATRSIGLSELPSETNNRTLDVPPSSTDVAELVFTSGTTGSPKGVTLTHANIVANIESALGLVPRRPMRLVSLLPLSHMLEQTVGLYGPLRLGSTIHYPISRTAATLLKAMRRQSTTTLVLVPQVLELMLHDIEREVERQGKTRRWQRIHQIADHLPMKLRRALFYPMHQNLGGGLDFVICGGAALPADIAGAWERMGVRVLEGYGATECAPIVAGNTYWDSRHGTVGRPVPGVDVKLSGAGEVMVKGPNVTPGYREGPTSTRPAVDSDGWYRTGDLGDWDDAGRLRITGRLADRIVLPSGLNLYPRDIETELRAEPEVADCVVVMAPDRVGTSRPHAVLIPSEATADSAADHKRLGEAVRRAGSRLAPHQRVAGFTVWTADDFPRTNLLKVKRHEVAAALALRSTEPEPPPAARPAGDDTLERVRGLLAEVGAGDPESITRDSDLTLDAGLDSLARVELAMLLEDELGLDVEDNLIAGLEHVGALCSLIDGAEHRTPAPAAAAWPRKAPARGVRAALQHLVLFPLHRAFAHPFVVDCDSRTARARSPVLIIANHASHLDTPSVLRALPRRLRSRTAVAAAADYFYRSRGLGAIASLILGTFPFSRTGGVRSSLELCGELVDEGCSVLIYPEGTRSTSGAMARFQSGIGLLAADLGLPVIPIGLGGTHAVWPKGARRPRRGPVTVRIGAPIHVAPDADPAETVVRLERAVADLARSAHRTAA